MGLPMEELPVKTESQQAIRDALVADDDRRSWREREVTNLPWLASRTHERHCRQLPLGLSRKGQPGVGREDQGVELRYCPSQAPDISTTRCMIAPGE